MPVPPRREPTRARRSRERATGDGAYARACQPAESVTARHRDATSSPHLTPPRLLDKMSSELKFVGRDGFGPAFIDADKIFIVAPSSALKDGTALEALRTSKTPLAVSLCSRTHTVHVFCLAAECYPA